MRYVIIVGLAVMIMSVQAGCWQGDVATLEEENAILKRDFAYVTQMIDEVQHNLTQIEEREGLISRLSFGIEAGAPFEAKDVRDEMMTSLAAIDTYLAENRRKLAELGAQVDSSSLQMEGLNRLVASLQQKVEQKDHDIKRLRTRVDALERNVAQLKGEIKEKEEVLETKDLTIQAQADSIEALEEAIRSQVVTLEAREAAFQEEMMTVYYVVGTKDGLSRKGLISEEKSGLFGLRKRIKVSDVDARQFSPIRKTQNRVQLGPDIKEVKVLSAHKDFPDAYSVEQQGNFTSLHLPDPQAFWQVSDYLVVLIEQ